MKTNKNEEFFRAGIQRIMREQKLPKLAVLVAECSPAFNSKKMKRRIEYAVRVLEVEQNLKVLWQAISWTQHCRKAMFGTHYDLPVRFAWGILRDLQDGRDIFNPSAEDIRNSKLLEVTVKEYVPVNITLDDFNHHLFEYWVESLIENHRDDLKA